MTAGERLRALLSSGDLVVAPGAYDAITAKLVQAAGFPAVYMTGAGTVNAHLGLPDIALATMTEVVANAQRIADVVTLPVVCDADTGYGNAVNVVRTVRAFEAAGVAGIHLEDQVSPKRCGHLEGKEVVPVGEMVGKLRAATAAREGDLVVIARTDAAAVEGVDAAIARAKAYADAGADLIFPEALTSPEELARFAAAEVGVPLLANMTEFGKTPYLSTAEFQRLGYAVVIFPMLAFRTMLKAVRQVLVELAREGTQRHLLDRMMTRQELYELLDYPAYREYERRFVEQVDA